MSMPPNFNWSWSFDEDASPSHAQNESSSNNSTDGSSTNNANPTSAVESESSFEEDLASFLENPTTWPDVPSADTTEPVDYPDFTHEPATNRLPTELIEMSAVPFEHFKDIPAGFVRTLTFDVDDLWHSVFSWDPFRFIRAYLRNRAGYKLDPDHKTNVAEALDALAANDTAGCRALVETLETERDDARDHLTIAVSVIAQAVNYSDDMFDKYEAAKGAVEMKLRESKNENAVIEKELKDSKSEMDAVKKEVEDLKLQHEKELADIKLQHEKELGDIKCQHDQDLRESNIAHIRAELHLIESKLDVEHYKRDNVRKFRENRNLFKKLQDSHMAFEYLHNLTAGYRDIAARQVENLKGQLREANAKIWELEEELEVVEEEVDVEWVEMIERKNAEAECVQSVNERRRVVWGKELMM